MKLIVYNVKGVLTTQLFDLKKDPWEINDLSKELKYKQTIQNMRAMLKKQMKEYHDDLDIDLPDWGRKQNQKTYGS